MKLKRFFFGCRKLLNHKFTVITLLLTRRCNLRCDYCGTVKRGGLKELGLSQWKHIVDKLSRRYCIFVFSGGEPLLYSGLYELIDYTSSRGITGLLTNGSLLTEDNFKRLKRLDYLYLSFDTIGQGEDFKSIDPNKLELVTHYAGLYNIATIATAVITSKNMDEVPAIIKLLDRYNIGLEVCLVQPDTTHNLVDSFSYFFDTDGKIARLERLQMSLIGMIKKGYKILTPLSYILNMSRYIRGTYRLRCTAGKTFFTVNNDGLVMACHNLPPADANLLDDVDLGEIEKSLRQGILDGCNCFWDCYYSNSNLFNHPFNSILEYSLSCSRRWGRRITRSLLA